MSQIIRFWKTAKTKHLVAFIIFASCCFAVAASIAVANGWKLEINLANWITPQP